MCGPVLSDALQPVRSFSSMPELDSWEKAENMPPTE